MEEGMTDQQQQSISNTCVSSGGKNKYCSCGKLCLRNWRVRAHTSDCLVTNDCKKNKRNCAEGDFFSAPPLACSGVIPPPTDRQGTDCQDTPAHFLTLLLLLHIPPHELFRFLKILPPYPRGGKKRGGGVGSWMQNAKEKRNSLWACSWVWNSHIISGYEIHTFNFRDCQQQFCSRGKKIF